MTTDTKTEAQQSDSWLKKNIEKKYTGIPKPVPETLAAKKRNLDIQRLQQQKTAVILDPIMEKINEANKSKP